MVISASLLENVKILVRSRGEFILRCAISSCNFILCVFKFSKGEEEMVFVFYLAVIALFAYSDPWWSWLRSVVSPHFDF